MYLIFRLYHIINIAFDNVQRVYRPALYLELLISKRNIFVVKRVGSNVSGKFCGFKEIHLNSLANKRLFLLNIELHTAHTLKRVDSRALYLLLAQKAVMLASALAVGEAVGTNQNFEPLAVLLGNFRKRLHIVVPVVVQHHKAVVLFKLPDKPVHIPYLLAGGGGYLVFGEILSDVILNYLSVDNSLIQPVVRKFKEPVAKFVIDVLLGDVRVCKSKTAGDTS